MSHEMSETEDWGMPGKPMGMNVSGYTKQPLVPEFAFEPGFDLSGSLSYSGVPNADAAAEARSNLFGQLVNAMQQQRMQDQRMGMSLPFLPSVNRTGMQAAEQHAFPQPIAPPHMQHAHAQGEDATIERMMQQMGY